jgi:hypothetical protein
MAIKRGGGPSGPKVPPRPETQPAPSLKGARGADEARADEARTAASFDADGFDDDLSGPGVTRSASGDRAEDVFGRPEQRHSSVKNTERLLETTYDRLAEDYTRVHTAARGLVDDLAAAGFSQAALDDKAPELRAQRARMAKVRARLSNIRRRLRTLALPAGSALELQLAQRLEGRIRAVSDLERGAERTLMALQLATTFRPRTADGAAAQITRVPIGGPAGRHALGSALAELAPDAAASGTMLRLLTRQAPAPVEAPSLEGSSDLEALRSFALAQHGT